MRYVICRWDKEGTEGEWSVTESSLTPRAVAHKIMLRQAGIVAVNVYKVGDLLVEASTSVQTIDHTQPDEPEQGVNVPGLYANIHPDPPERDNPIEGYGNFNIGGTD